MTEDVIDKLMELLNIEESDKIASLIITVLKNYLIQIEMNSL